MSTTRLTAELVVDGRWELGEGPIWDTQTGSLVWVDIMGQQVLRHRPGDERAFALPTPLDVGAVAVRQGGGLIAALADGFWTTEPESEEWVRHRPVEADQPDLRFNDGKCDPAGRFLAGSMAYDKRTGAGALYRLDPDGTVEQLLDGVTISNGLAWSPDGGTLYYIDTPLRRVDAFDYDLATGRLSNRRPHITFPAELAGNPDGMTIDTDGGLWVAMWTGWGVHRYAPDGTLDLIVDVPASHVTSAIFGGPDLTDLYITCAWSELTDEERAEQPHAGSLFGIRTGFRGYPPAEFAG
jgi:sugar lactone lactonase YvrE